LGNYSGPAPLGRALELDNVFFPAVLGDEIRPYPFDFQIAVNPPSSLPKQVRQKALEFRHARFALV
jgi:hypothetical protein